MSFVPDWKEPFLAQYPRWILWVPVFIALGVGIYFALPTEPALGIASLWFVLSFILLFQPVRHPAWKTSCIILLCVSTGFGAGALRTLTAGTAFLQQETKVVQITGTVEGVEADGGSTRVLLNGVTLSGLGKADTPKRVRVKMSRKYGTPPVGGEISVKGVLMPPPPPVAPESYDFQRHMFFQGIGGTGYAVAPFENLQSPEAKVLHAEKIREAIKAKVLSVKGSQESKAVLIALLTGERRMIPEETMENIRKAGIAHLLAISGLHIGLVAGMVFALVRLVLVMIPYCAIYWPTKKISAIVAFAAILFYGWLVGSPVSADRAIIMTGVVLFAILIDRIAISLRLAAFAAALILLWAPESLMMPGFQMSFAAVVCLIAFYEVWQYKLSRHYYGRGIPLRITGYATATFVTTLIATLATAPFALFHFQRVALLPGLLANLVAVPMTAFLIMPLGLLSVLLMPMGWEPSVISLNAQFIDQILRLAETAANSDHSVLVWPIWPQEALALITLGMLWIVIWQGRLRLWGILPIILAFAVISSYNPPDIRIGPDGKIVGIYDGEGLLLSNTRAARFTRKVWQSEYGMPETQGWEDIAENTDALTCDTERCVWEAGGNLFGFPKNQVAAYYDCQNADVVIAPLFYEMPSDCYKRPHILRGEIKRGGAHAIYIDEAGFQVVSSRDRRGVRPWTQYEN